MKNIILLVAYDGTDFYGWQKIAAGTPTIEQELETTLQQILQHPVSLQAASRTDRGVHADGQVVNFYLSKESVDLHRLKHSLNSLLPETIRVLKVYEAPSHAFHPTLDSTGKHYIYRIATAEVLMPHLRFTHWHFPHALDINAMSQAAAHIIGERDFAAFRTARKGQKRSDSVRTLFDVQVETLDKDLVYLHMKGNNFLYKMARTLAGTLAYIGCGKLSAEQIPLIFTQGKRANAGMTAPACGLTLHEVYYSTQAITSSQEEGFR